MSSYGNPKVYFHHDDRGDERRVTYFGKNKTKSKWWKKRGNHDYRDRNMEHHRNVKVDNDVDMNVNFVAGARNRKLFERGHNAERRKGRRKNMTGPRLLDLRNEIQKELQGDVEKGWYKIIIPNAKKWDKAFILKHLESHSRTPFQPYNFHMHTNDAVFYVNGAQAANGIRNTANYGFHGEVMMNVIVNRSAPPITTLDSDVIEKIKTCMSRRYSAVDCSLDLTRFHNDSDLEREGLFVPLSRSNVMNTIIGIIKENIPGVVAMNLSNNKLASLEPLAQLVHSCKHLKSLNLNYNRLLSINELNYIKGLELIELMLNSNPLHRNFKSHQAYVSAIREKFPKVIKLDFKDLPPAIVVDLGNTETLPPSKGNFFPADDVKQLVVQFLEQYYTIFDSGDRNKLTDAYHDQAQFSFAMSRASSRKNLLSGYLTESRNLLRVRNNNVRYELLKRGRQNIIATLTRLPQTQHDPSSFTVDISHVSATLMCFTVAGVFKEANPDARDLSLWTFNRTFLVIAQGQGFSVINECFFITNATSEQFKVFKNSAAALPVLSQHPVSSRQITHDDKHRMAIEFSKETGMILEFSLKCLEENEWDHAKSLHVFHELNSRGSIPPEAFIN